MNHLVLLNRQTKDYFKISDGIKTMFAYGSNSAKSKYDKIKIEDDIYLLESTKGIIKAKCKVLDKLVIYDKEEAKMILDIYRNELQIEKNEIKKLIQKPFVYIFEICDFELINPIMYLKFSKIRDIFSFKEFNEDFLKIEISKITNDVYINYFKNKKLLRQKKKEKELDDEYNKKLLELFPYEETLDDTNENISDSNEESNNNYEETPLSPFEEEYFNMLEQKLIDANLSLEDLENIDLNTIDFDNLDKLKGSIDSKDKSLDISSDKSSNNSIDLSSDDISGLEKYLDIEEREEEETKDESLEEYKYLD